MKTLFELFAENKKAKYYCTTWGDVSWDYVSYYVNYSDTYSLFKTNTGLVYNLASEEATSPIWKFYELVEVQERE
jgi:hypothetical protein